MAQKGVHLDQETLSCSICLDPLKDPVAIPCGHSYCMNCIKVHWDEENQKKLFSCPQCRETFTSRPRLVKNTLLAALVEELKKTGLQAAPADHCYAGAEDVACDVCTGRKLKALKSCLQCLGSFCDEHLQPHLQSPIFEKHKLVEPSRRLQENICSRHDEVMKIFCRSDQQIICYLCSMEEHRGHDTVTAAAERTERQRELEGSRHNIQQRIQDRQKELKLLQQEVEDISRSADKTVEDSQEIFTQLISVMEQRRRDVEQQVRSQQEAEVSRVKELEEKLEQEIRELKRKDAELKKLSDTEDHSQFLQDYPSLSGLSGSTHSSSINIRPLRHFEDVTAAVSKLRDQLQELLRDTWTNISLAVTEPDVLLSEPGPGPGPGPEPRPRPRPGPGPGPEPGPRPRQQPEPGPEPGPRPRQQPEPGPVPGPGPEPKTRAEFLKYSRKITLDPNTANRRLILSDGNRKVTRTSQPHSYPDHPDRFTHYCQVLSRESLTGRCYWELEWSGRRVEVAVTHKNISRKGSESEFGSSDKSWSLQCHTNSFIFYHDSIETPVSGPGSSRLGVYLDHRAGLLSFYSISGTMTLLHRVQTTFTEPLHVGLWVDPGSTAELCEMK